MDNRLVERLPIFTKRFKKLQGDRLHTEFADFLGISRQTVGFYYNGNRAPDALTLVKIARKCGVSSDWLLGLSDKKEHDVSISEYTGLTESSIEAIRKLDKEAMAGLNTFLSATWKDTL